MPADERPDRRDHGVPTGLPDDAPESDPLGVPEARPEGEGEPPRGPEAMPGVPTDGEPPAAS